MLRYPVVSNRNLIHRTMQYRGQLHNHLDPSFQASDSDYDRMHSEYENEGTNAGKKGTFARGAGLIILLLVVFFVLQRFFLPFGPDISALFKVIPVTGTILVIVIGLGLLTRARSGRNKSYDSEWTPKTETTYSTGAAGQASASGSVMDTDSGTWSETDPETGPRSGKKRGSKSKDSSSSSSFTSGERRAAGHDDDPYGYEMNRKWYRSHDEKMVFGVCGGIAERFDVDPTIVRALFALAFLSYGFSFVIYIVLAVVMPKKPRHSLL